MERVFLVSGARTPFGSFGGALKDIPITDLSARVLAALMEKAGINKEAVEEIFWGCGDTAEAEDEVTPVVARQALLQAGFRPETVSLNIDRACCSGTAAIQMAYRAIKSGEVGVAIAGGAEMLSRTPYTVRDVRWGSNRIGAIQMRDPLFALGYQAYNPVAVDAGEVALEYGVDRVQQDSWALQSQQRWSVAQAAGRFADEVFPVELPVGKTGTRVMDTDESPRPGVTLEKLSKLSTIYGSLTCTAGNAPGLNDGASAILLVNQRQLDQLGLTPLAEVLTVACIAAEPRLIPVTPALAIKEALRRTNLQIQDLQVIEINEAFAAMPLVSTLIMADGDAAELERLRSITNPNGGAIAMGHPLAASGARITMTAAYELRRRGGGVGVSAICGGLGQGDAVLLRS